MAVAGPQLALLLGRARFGATDQQLEELGNQIKRRNTHRSEQRNAVPIAAGQRDETERKAEERDCRRREAGELQSDWPQPDKAWGHVDRGPLVHIVKARKARAKAAASQSNRPKSLIQQQMQQQQ